MVYKQVYLRFPGSEDGTFALQAIDFELDADETLCLVGPSGCGKSTTLRTANRMLATQSGEILFRGRAVNEYDPLELRRQMGYIPQNAQLLPHLTVLQNVELLPRLTGQAPTMRRDRACELLELVNLPADNFGDRYPRTLSGGQQQRVAIARALALDPPCLLMDEPFSALDTITRKEIEDEFIQMRKAVHKTILLVTHNLKEAFILGDKVALMNEGRILQRGTKEDFINHPADAFTEGFMRDYLAS